MRTKGTCYVYMLARAGMECCLSASAMISAIGSRCIVQDAAPGSCPGLRWDDKEIVGPLVAHIADSILPLQ